MAMALSCGRRRQKVKQGGGGRSCRHFHVHYHLPRRARGFSLLRSLPPRLSLLSYALIPPVLFFAVLAFLVLFVWFTLLYFLRTLWSKDGGNESLETNSDGHGNDADYHGEQEDAEEEEEEAGKTSVEISSEFSEDSASAEECANKRFEIGEVHVESDEPEKVLRMESSCARLNHDVQTTAYDEHMEEVIIFEIERGEREATVSSDELSERHQVQDLRVEEIKSTDAIKSGDSFPFVLSTISGEFYSFCNKNEVIGLTMHSPDENNQNIAVLIDTSCHRGISECQGYGEEFSDVKEAPALNSSGTPDFIDKHETRQVIPDDCANEDTANVLLSVYGSVHDWIQYERKEDNTEQEHPKSLPPLVDSIAIVFCEQKETEKTVIVGDTNLTEVSFLNGEQIVNSSDELISGFTSEEETPAFPFVSVCQHKNGEIMAYSSASSQYNIGDKDEKCTDLTEKKIEEASSTASAFCGYADPNRAILEAPDCFGNEGKIGEVISLEKSSIHGSVEDKDNKSNGNCISEIWRRSSVEL